MNLTVDKSDLVIELSKLMALYHAQGWKASQEFNLIPVGMTASEWANSNYSAYIYEAGDFVKNNLKCK